MVASAGESTASPEPPSTVSDEEVQARSPHVFWLTPNKPANISVGRDRIAEHLDADGIEVTIHGATPSTVLAALREHDTYDGIVGTTRSGAIARAFLSILTNTPLIVDHVDPIRQLRETHSAWLAVLVRWLENIVFWLSERVLFVYEEESHVSRVTDAALPTELGVDYDRIANPSPTASKRLADDLRTMT